MHALDLRLSTSPGYPRLTTGIPVGKPAGMETRGSESLVITGLRGSGCMFWVLRVPAAGTCGYNFLLSTRVSPVSFIKIMYIHVDTTRN
jgi:hypothetical protein